MKISQIVDYVKDRVTKKELSTLIGVMLMIAGPAGWLSAEHVVAVKSFLSAFGLVDPGVTSSGIVALGAALFAAKEKS